MVKKCSVCKKANHNKRTCKKVTTKTSPQIAPPPGALLKVVKNDIIAKELLAQHKTNPTTPSQEWSAFLEQVNYIESTTDVEFEYTDGLKNFNRKKFGEPHRKQTHDSMTEIVYTEGVKEWRKDGKLHNEKGPARIYPEGREEWYLNGLLHRTDGPAVTDEKGQQQNWYLNGEPHRDNGPAVKNEHIEIWYSHGVIHRSDGPAIMRENPDTTKNDRSTPDTLTDERETEFWWKGKKSEQTYLCTLAVSSFVKPEQLFKLCGSKDYTLRNIAASQPACPPEGRILCELLNR